MTALAEYIAELKATEIARKIAADPKLPAAFRRGLLSGLQMVLPGDAGLMADRGPAPSSMPVQMPGDPYSGGGR
jgi:hypothetical protein